jgi:flagellin-like hook-associated protein FlgL
MRNATAFATKLEAFLGVNGTSPASFTPDSGSTGGTTGLDRVVPGPCAVAGTYALSYKVDSSGNFGTLKVSNGLTASSCVINSSGHQIVKMDNGIDIYLGSNFQMNTNLSPRVFNVYPGTSTSFGFQVAENVGDLSKVSFKSTSLDALGLTDIDINTPSNAAEASARISNALSSVSYSYAKLGAQQKQMEVYQESNTTNIIHMQNALSQFVDTDILDSISRMGKSGLQYEIASVMLLQAGQRTLQLLSLFS